MSIIRALPISGFLLFLTSLSGFAQTKTVTGKVLTDSGTALAGASVTIKGSNIGTITGADGSFSLKAAPKDILEISGIGYASQQVKIGSSSELSVTLTRSTSSLNEIVVVGYGTVKRKDLTGAISSIGSAAIEQVPVVDVQQAIQGRASGVQVINNDASPGGNISVLIRGTGSLAPNGNNPLYVIDGYPISGGLNNFNPNDIASIDILKDASATAIYGIRAANGVVIITTKKGRKDGSVQVSLDASLSFQSKPKEFDVLNAQDFAVLSNQVEAADSTHTYKGMPLWHTPDSLHNVDWQNALYGSGLTQNYNLGIRGGTEKVQTAMSFGYYNQKGIIENSYFKRFTLGLNLIYTPVKWLRSATSANYSNLNANNPYSNNSTLVQLSELPPTLDNGNKLTYQIKDGLGNYGFYNPTISTVAKFGNPLYSVETNQYSNITNYLLANTSLEATLFEGFKIKTLAGVNTSNYNGSYFQPDDHRALDQYPGAIPASALYSQHLNNTFEWLWENTISYDRTFGPHAIHFVGGISAQKNTNTFSGGSIIPPNNTIRDLSQGTNLKLDPYNSTAGPGNGQTIATLESQFARLSYAFEDKYLITGTIRRDGSSKFDTANKYGVFPSGAVAWRMKEESFLKDVNWLTDLKLRGSYGEVGNQQPIGLFQYQALYSTGLGPNIGGTNGISNLGYPFNKLYQQGYAQIQPANPDLKWETDYQTDIGLDAAFLQGDLSFTVDWYLRKSKDFLLTLAAPAQTGYTTFTKNVGSMENTGVEFAVTYSHHKNRDFHYSLALTLTTNKNTLTSLTSGASYINNFGSPSAGNVIPTGNGWDQFTKTSVGGPVGEFFGYKTLGIFQSQKQIDALNAASVAKNPLFPNYQQAANRAGDRYYADLNGDGHVDAKDRTALGNPQPDFFGGFTFDATYKSWDFTAFFYGVYGNKIMNYVQNSLETFQKRGSEGIENVGQDYAKNRWTPTNPSNRYARAVANDDGTLNSVPSDVYVENGSYLKLKNLSIGYTLPASLSSRASLSRVRIYISTQNLFTITKYSGLDPEIGIQGGNPTQNGLDNGVYPSSRYYTVGLNVTF